MIKKKKLYDIIDDYLEYYDYEYSKLGVRDLEESLTPIEKESLVVYSALIDEFTTLKNYIIGIFGE